MLPGNPFILSLTGRKRSTAHIMQDRRLSAVTSPFSVPAHLLQEPDLRIIQLLGKIYIYLVWIDQALGLVP